MTEYFNRDKKSLTIIETSCKIRIIYILSSINQKYKIKMCNGRINFEKYQFSLVLRPFYFCFEL